MAGGCAGVGTPWGAVTRSAVRGLILAALALIGLGLALWATTATATFPGENGKIVFASKRTGENQVWMMNADGSDQKQLTHSKHGGQTGFPSFSSDGKGIVFASNDNPQHNWDIYSMTPAGDTSGARVERWTNNSCVDQWPALAPGPYVNSDSKVVYAEACPGRNFSVMSMPFANAPDSSGKQLTSRPGDELRPSYSPDGRSIVYDAIWPEGQGNKNVRLVTLMNSDGSKQRPLIPGCFAPWRVGENLPDCTEQTRDGSFAPGGNRIAYTYEKDRKVGHGTEHTRGIAVMDSDGGNVERVVESECDAFHPCFETPLYQQPAWSPDASRLAYIRRPRGGGDDYDIWATRPSSKLTSQGFNYQPDWGPKPQP